MPTKKKPNTLKTRMIALLDEIDDEGLLFLIRQANTLVYNRKVDELNRQADELDRSGKKNSAKKTSQTRKGKTADTSLTDFPVTIERGAFGSSYIMALKNARKTFGESEMLALVRVCHAATGKADGRARVYRWLKKNRDDVLLDAGISPSCHGTLGGIYETIRDNFKIRE